MADEEAINKKFEEELENLRDQIAELQDEQNDGFFPRGKQCNFIIKDKPRRTLKGHFGKIYALHWSGPRDGILNHVGQVATVSQDGKLIIWDAHTANKSRAINLRSSWMMTCAFERSTNAMVARGGLDNHCTIHPLSGENERKMSNFNEDKTRICLGEHDGYVSCCRFASPNRLISGSGDTKIASWDVESKTRERDFLGHTGDIMGIEFNPADSNIFASASVDTTAKWWDQRTERAAFTFRGHESDVNAIDFLSNGNTIVTGSDDSSAMLFDIRCLQQINALQSDSILAGITSVAASSSGRLVIAGYDDYSFRVWDTLMHIDAPGSRKPFTPSVDGHLDRVSCVGVEATGKAIATGSWDELVKIWA